MAEYIDREKVLIEMDCGIRAGNYEEGFENYQHVNCMDDCLDVVRYADTADVAPVIHAKWIIDDSEEFLHLKKIWNCHCSNCNKDPLNFVGGSENWWTYEHKLPPYCPYCSAKMDKE